MPSLVPLKEKGREIVDRYRRGESDVTMETESGVIQTSQGMPAAARSWKRQGTNSP